LSASFPASVDASSTVSMVRLSFRSMPCRLTTSSSQASVPVFCTATRIRSACALEAPSTIISKTRCGAHAKTMPQPTPVASCNTIRLSRRHTDGLDAECSTESMSKTRRDRSPRDVHVALSRRPSCRVVPVLRLGGGRVRPRGMPGNYAETIRSRGDANCQRAAEWKVCRRTARRQLQSTAGIARSEAASPILCRSRSKPLKRRPKVDRLVTFAVTEITGTGAVPLTVRWQIDILQRR
jgi:hypothetical protein